jgi:methylated-DNA-[protein]-cysteine S-methyltransferase
MKTDYHLGAGETAAEGTADTSYGRLYFLLEGEELIYCGFHPCNDPKARLPRRLAQHLRGKMQQPVAAASAETVQNTARKLQTYLNGERGKGQTEIPPMRFYGTDFQMRVWKELLKIPAGRVWSYGKIAAAAGRPRAVRAVGSAVGSNPLAPLVPCHRVLPAGGGLGNYGGGAAVKQRLLELEGAPLSVSSRRTA